jgi:hypothetical protein
VRGGCHFVRFLFRYILCVLNHDGLRFVDEVVKHRLNSRRKNVNVFQRPMFAQRLSLSFSLHFYCSTYYYLLKISGFVVCIWVRSLSLSRALFLSRLRKYEYSHSLVRHLFIYVLCYIGALSLSLSFSAYFPSAFKVKISSVTSSISAA